MIKRQSAERCHAALNSGPAHKLDLDTILRDLERYNALRRAEGRSVIHYGRYVAMRDGYIHIEDPAAVRQGALNGRQKKRLSAGS